MEMGFSVVQVSFIFGKIIFSLSRLFLAVGLNLLSNISIGLRPVGECRPNTFDISHIYFLGL